MRPPIPLLVAGSEIGQGVGCASPAHDLLYRRLILRIVEIAEHEEVDRGFPRQNFADPVPQQMRFVSAQVFLIHGARGRSFALQMRSENAQAETAVDLHRHIQETAFHLLAPTIGFVRHVRLRVTLDQRKPTEQHQMSVWIRRFDKFSLAIGKADGREAFPEFLKLTRRPHFAKAENVGIDRLDSLNHGVGGLGGFPRFLAPRFQQRGIIGDVVSRHHEVASPERRICQEQPANRGTEKNTARVSTFETRAGKKI